METMDSEDRNDNFATTQSSISKLSMSPVPHHTEHSGNFMWSLRTINAFRLKDMTPG